MEERQGQLTEKMERLKLQQARAHTHTHSSMMLVCFADGVDRAERGSTEGDGGGKCPHSEGESHQERGEGELCRGAPASGQAQGHYWCGLYIQTSCTLQDRNKFYYLFDTVLSNLAFTGGGEEEKDRESEGGIRERAG